MASLFRTIHILISLVCPFVLLGQTAGKLCAVAFYNTENLFDPTDEPGKDDEEFTPAGANRYTQEIYRKKLHNIATAISVLGTDRVAGGADIVGLAEVENKTVLAALTAQPELKNRGYKYLLYEGPDPRGIDVALLYNPQAFKLLSSRPVPVKMDSKATRDILYVHGILRGDTVHLLVNHWPSRREGQQATDWERRQAATVNRRLIDSLLHRNAQARIILMGDLNDNPANASVATVLKGKEDRNSLQPQDLYNPWIDIHRSGTGTSQYKRKWDLFDQVLCSRALATGKKGWVYSSAAICNRDFLRERNPKYRGAPYRSYGGRYWKGGYSDHFPVVLYLKR